MKTHTQLGSYVVTPWSHNAHQHCWGPVGDTAVSDELLMNTTHWSHGETLSRKRWTLIHTHENTLRRTSTSSKGGWNKLWATPSVKHAFERVCVGGSWEWRVNERLTWPQGHKVNWPNATTDSPRPNNLLPWINQPPLKILEIHSEHGNMLSVSLFTVIPKKVNKHKSRHCPKNIISSQWAQHCYRKWKLFGHAKGQNWNFPGVPTIQISHWSFILR